MSVNNSNIGIILIDDSLIDRTIVKKNMELFHPEKPFVNFTSAREALDAFESGVVLEEAEKCVILLDIYMPEMNGFQFVDRFNDLNSVSTKRCCIMMLSSSIDSGDMDKVAGRERVHKFISKPLNEAVLKQVMADAETYFSVNRQD